MNQILYTTDKRKSNLKHKINSIGIWIVIFTLLLLFTVFFNITINSKAMVDNNKSQEEILLGNLNAMQQENKNIGINGLQNVAGANIASNREESQAATKTIKVSNGKTYEAVAVLKIPSLNIEYPVLSKTSTELLKVSLNKYWGANPNEIGNMCIVGHNYENGTFFSNLSNIKKGAIIQITDMTGKTLEYRVYHTEVVGPYDMACTSQLTDGNTEITLITCHSNGTQRFIVKARV